MPKLLVAAAPLALVGLLTGCSGTGGVGDQCGGPGDCGAGLQCLQGTCVPECRNDLECGDGFVCGDGGACTAVSAAIGDACARERDCGPGQRCQIDAADGDADGWLAASCQIEGGGSPPGVACDGDADCRSGICAIGRCSEVCAADTDCAGGSSCAAIPRLESSGAPLFRGCLPAVGAVTWSIPVTEPHQTIRVPVPSTALSFAMITRISDDTQLVGAARVVSPSGRLLYATPFSQEEFYQNPIRHLPAPAVATLLVPNTPAVEIETGVYSIEVGSFFPAGGNGTAIPTVDVVYKLSPANTLDLNLYFLDLANHPCLGGDDLSAATAPTSTAFLSYLDRLRSILAAGGISLGQVHFADVMPRRPDLDGLRAADLPHLLRLSSEESGISVFFVRSISPVGIQALAGGGPGPPRLPGTAASGIAIATDTLCYRDWPDLARTTAHQIGHFMGLFRNREPDGALDPIPDSDDTSDNLMYFSEFGGVELSKGQAHVLGLYPGLR